MIKKQNNNLTSHDKQWQVSIIIADKSSAEDNKDKGYDAYLKDLVEKAKDELSKEDYELLTKDVEEIAKLEEEITKLKAGNESASNKKEDGAVSTKELKKFPTFNSKDFDGNYGTKDIFKDKKLTLVNFWFNGCAPCIGELPKLQQLNDEIEKNGWTSNRNKYSKDWFNRSRRYGILHSYKWNKAKDRITYETYA